MSLYTAYLVFRTQEDDTKMASSANQLSPTNPKKGWFSIGVLCLIITLYAYSFKLEISTLSLIAENVMSLKIKPVVIPLIVMMPTFFVLIYGIYQRMHGDISEKSMRRGLFVIIGCFPLFLITWWIYSWQLSDKLESEGYSICHWYSGASLGAPKIWLSDPSYCIEDGYLVRIELLEWLKQQRLSGKTPSIEVFEKQLEFMLSEYHQKYGV